MSVLRCYNMGSKAFIIVKIELLKVAVRDPLSSDDFLNCRTASCNHKLKELKSCNYHCLLGLLVYFQKSHSFFLFVSSKRRYNRKLTKHVATSILGTCYFAERNRHGIFREILKRGTTILMARTAYLHII